MEDIKIKTEIKRGEINNCTKCLASYGKYNNDPNSNFTEYWCEIPKSKNLIIKKPKGLCQFCNKDSRILK